MTTRSTGAPGADTMQGGSGQMTATSSITSQTWSSNKVLLPAISTRCTHTSTTRWEPTSKTWNLVGSAVKATGNSLNNILRGTDGNNILDGAAGADVMIGGAGDDTYIVDNVSDVVTENFRWDGNDTVRASVNYVLSEYVENLTLTGSSKHLRHWQ
jgi:Ca2+-binding RTX toxin-like protein